MYWFNLMIRSQFKSRGPPRGWDKINIRGPRRGHTVIIYLKENKGYENYHCINLAILMINAVQCSE